MMMFFVTPAFATLRHPLAGGGMSQKHIMHKIKLYKIYG